MGIQTSFMVAIFFVLTWWITTEIEKSYILSSNLAELIIFVIHEHIAFKVGHSTKFKVIFLEVSMVICKSNA